MGGSEYDLYFAIVGQGKGIARSLSALCPELKDSSIYPVCGQIE